METCPYCGSGVEKVDHQFYYCEFCDMRLTEVKRNQERLSTPCREFAFDTDMHKSTPELMTMPTYELLFLLKLVRGERSGMYGNMHVLHRAGEETDRFKVAEKQSGKDYLYLTKKMFVIENILRQRLGYVPTKITNQYLARYLDHVKNHKKGRMSIRTERKEKKR